MHVIKISFKDPPQLFIKMVIVQKNIPENNIIHIFSENGQKG